MDNNAITFYYQNCRGLRSKLHTLYMNILLHNYDIIILTETWLTSDIYDNELMDSRYVLFRSDRDRVATGRRDGGGVLVAVRRSLSTDARVRIVAPPPLPPPAATPLPAAIVDYVTIALEFNTNTYTISAAYIPDSQKYDVYLSYVSYLLNVYECFKDTYFFVIGDFNLPSLEWRPNYTHMLPLHTSPFCRSVNLLISFLTETKSFQFNHIRNKTSKILDLFISNKTGCNLLPAPVPLVPIDGFHIPFYATVPTERDCRHMQSKPQSKHCFHRADYKVINDEIIGTDWNLLFKNKPSESVVHTFYETLYSIISKNVPTKIIKKSSFPIWFNSSLRHIFTNKKNAWIKWKKYNNLSDYESFAMFRDRLKINSEMCYKNYITKVEESIKNNIKYFWSYIANKKKNNDIPSCVYYREIMSSEPRDICNMYSTYFRSVFEPSTVPDGYNIGSSTHTVDNPTSDLIISDLNFTLDNVRSELRRLDPTKGTGADNIPPLFLKYTADTICFPVQYIFNLCIREGVFPHIWKVARITPIYKEGLKKDVENYRPISILPSLSKLFERLIHNAVYPSLHNIIIPQQHGFVRRRSTVTNLLVYTTEIFRNLDKNKQTDSVYTDIKKAFDRVDHRILLDKIAYNGIRGNLWRWFKSYITNRSQKVVINGFESDLVPISSGVPQGSILGPLLFILYINDIKNCFKFCNFLLYADDLKVYHTINNYQDHLNFQQDLDRFSAYCLKNNLLLSINKCKSITFTRKLNVSSYTYVLCNTNLEKVQIIKDLGITLDSKLTLDVHIENITARGFKMFNFVIRSSIYFKNEITYLLLYKSLVRSQLEYAVSVWNPLYKCYIKNIERVQKKFLRCMHYKLCHNIIPYEKLLNKYKLLDLSSRRQQLDVMLLYDLVHNRYDCSELVNELRYKIPFRTSRYKHKVFAIATCRTKAGQRSPLYRMTSSYNDLFNCIDLFHERVGCFRRYVLDLLGGKGSDQL